MHLSRSERTRERGLAIVLVTLLMVVLLVFAAFAIDVGNGYNQRRQAQSAADAAALAAAQQTSASAAVSTAIEESRVNLAEPPDAASWQSDFAACSDPDRVARGYTVVTDTTDCVSFTSNMQRVRVYLPDIRISTYFGGVVGVESLQVSAFAEAQIDLGASGDILPYGLPSNAAGANEVCLKTGPNPNRTDYPYTSCTEGPTTGSFGRLDITLFGNPTVGTPTDCGQSNADRGVAFNTAFGVDHPLTTTPSATSGIHDRDDACPNFLIRPSIVDQQRGNTTNGLNEGMYYADVQGTGRPGRLAQVPQGWPSITVRAGYPEFDDRPLWEFITPGLTTSEVPNSCRAETFDDAQSNSAIGYATGEPPWRQDPYPATTANESKAHLIVCLEEYRSMGSPSVLFGRDSDGDPDNRHYDIMDSPRFGFVPELWEATIQNDNHIKDFRAVFLQTAYFACNGGGGGNGGGNGNGGGGGNGGGNGNSDGGCQIVFSPGSTDNIGVPSSGNLEMDAISAVLFSGSMLPLPIIEDRPGLSSSVQWALVR